MVTVNGTTSGSGAMLRVLGAARKREVKATQNLSVIVLFFMLCWFPLYTINFIKAFNEDFPVPTPLNDFFIILTHLNSAGNPLLYAYHLRDFRAALRSLLIGSPDAKKKIGRENSAYIHDNDITENKKEPRNKEIKSAVLTLNKNKQIIRMVSSDRFELTPKTPHRIFNLSIDSSMDLMMCNKEKGNTSYIKETKLCYNTLQDTIVKQGLVEKKRIESHKFVPDVANVISLLPIEPQAGSSIDNNTNLKNKCKCSNNNYCNTIGQTSTDDVCLKDVIETNNESTTKSTDNKLSVETDEASLIYHTLCCSCMKDNIIEHNICRLKDSSEIAESTSYHKKCIIHNERLQCNLRKINDHEKLFEIQDQTPDLIINQIMTKSETKEANTESLQINNNLNLTTSKDYDSEKVSDIVNNITDNVKYSKDRDSISNENLILTSNVSPAPHNLTECNSCCSLNESSRETNEKQLRIIRSTSCNYSFTTENLKQSDKYNEELCKCDHEESRTGNTLNADEQFDQSNRTNFDIKTPNCIDCNVDRQCSDLNYDIGQPEKVGYSDSRDCITVIDSVICKCDSDMCSLSGDINQKSIVVPNSTNCLNVCSNSQNKSLYHS